MEWVIPAEDLLDPSVCRGEVGAIDFVEFSGRNKSNHLGVQSHWELNSSKSAPPVNKGIRVGTFRRAVLATGGLGNAFTQLQVANG